MDDIKKQIMDIYKGIVSDLYEYKISIPVDIKITQEFKYVCVTVSTLGDSKPLYCRKYFDLASIDELSIDDIAWCANVELRRAFSELLSAVLSIE